MVIEHRHRVFVSLVVYSHNDAEAVVQFLEEIDSFIHDRFEHHELIVVDDGSTDGTPQLVRNVRPTTTLTLLQLSRHQGSEAAILAGLARATGDWIFDVSSIRRDWTCDLLGRLFNEAALGVDIVAAVGGNAGWARRHAFAMVNRYGSLALPPEAEPVRLVSRRALNAMLDLGERVRYRRALFAVTGFPSGVLRYAPVPGDLKPSRRRTRTVAIDALISASDAGLSLAYVVALAFTALSVLAGIYTAAAFVILPDVEKGWTTLMLVTSGGFAAVFFVLAIFGEYVGRILAEVRGRPAFRVGQETVIHSSTGRGNDPPLARLAERWEPDDRR